MQSKPTSAFTWLILVLAVPVIIGIVISGASKQRAGVVSASPPPVAPKLPSGYNPALKADRQSFIEEVQRGGLFGKLRVSNHVGKVFAGPKWYAATFEQKRKFADVAYQWCLDHDQGCDLLLVRDEQTNKDIASFSPSMGFRME